MECYTFGLAVMYAVFWCRPTTSQAHGGGLEKRSPGSAVLVITTIFWLDIAGKNQIKETKGDK